MCELKRISRCKVFTGYKLVAKRDSDQRYYSLAMGFPYPKLNKEEVVPVIERQKRLGGGFSNYILLNCSSREESMRGRTCAFRTIKSLFRQLLCLANNLDAPIVEGYEYCLVKVELSGDLMTGEYGCENVVGGRKIKIIKEFNIQKELDKLDKARKRNNNVI